MSHTNLEIASQKDEKSSRLLLREPQEWPWRDRAKKRKEFRCSKSKNERISIVTREKGWAEVAGNKRLANPRRQFNLATNPRENVNKDLATTSATLFRPTTSRGTRVLTRVQRHFIFAQRYRRWLAPTTWKLCAKRVVPAVRFSFPVSSLPLLFCYPFRGTRSSTLVIYHGYAADARGRIYGRKKKKKKKKKKRKDSSRVCNTIVSLRSSGLYLRHFASRRSAMKRSHGLMQRKCTPYNIHWFSRSPF